MAGRRLRSGTAALLAAGAGLIAAAPAQADIACSFDDPSNEFAVTVSSTGESGLSIRNEGGFIAVRRFDTTLSCLGGPAATNQVDKIEVNDLSGQPTWLTLNLQNAFAPGATDEAGGSDEIEIEASLGNDAADSVFLTPPQSTNSLRLGSISGGQGANLNPSSETLIGRDSDLSMLGVDKVWVRVGNPASTANDTVRADGGAEFTAPLSVPIDVEPGAGNDTLVGGAAADELDGANGNDTVSGGGGDDVLQETTGDDDLNGGPGVDTMWAVASAAMRVDLGLTDRQDTGVGRDRFTDVENVRAVGSAVADVLIGNGASNRLEGSGGNDLLIGRGGPLDVLFGGPGTDTVSYERSPAGVSVSLAQQPVSDVTEGPSQDTLSEGIDRLSGFEDLTGSPFPDTLAGSSASNTLRSRDGKRDTVTCGDGIDTAVADIAGTDSLAADCDVQQLDVRPDTAFASGPKPLSNDRTPTFAFRTTKAGATTQCSLDGAPFAACGSPRTTAAVSDGAHSFRVRSQDLFGFLDLSPAAQAFSVDTRAPRITRAKASKRVRRRKLATVRFSLSEAARARIAVQRCRRLSRSRKRCRRYAKAKTFTLRGRRGVNRKRFRLRTRGLYRATVVATDAAGNRSRARRLGLRVVR